MARTALLLALCLGIGACMAPPPQSARVMEAARDMNLAARFGRMDLAAELASDGARQAFLERRASWGKEVRVLDVELSGMKMQDEHNAMVQIDVAWQRADDATLRNTRIAQRWSDRDGGWQLTREQRVGGDVGLLGEKVKMVPVERRDVHFETRVIR